MTFDEFKKDFIDWLTDSTVNLGRRQTKTRDQFLETAAKRFDFYNEFGFDYDSSGTVPEQSSQPQKTNPMDDRLVRIKPKDSRKGLDMGKGVHAMTPSESQRADEQLNRSPFAGKSDKKYTTP